MLSDAVYPRMILIALGANLPSRAGPPAVTVKAALAALEPNGIAPKKVSTLYKTQAWPDPGDPPFVNAVAQVATALTPSALLRGLQEIERSFGRVRMVPNAPRTLDLDILDYDGRIEGGPPTLPHPRLERRAFVLVPLAEIAPDWRHPVSGRSAEELLANFPKAEKELVPLSSPDPAT
jgi:2-amino-4-hydroxy-6-hydroxymethyldihydropteridine diphosphokinase